MLFNSFVFLLIFVPVVYTLYWRLVPNRGQARLLFLTAASYIFYSYSNPWYALLLAGLSLLAWGCGLLLARYRRHALLLISIAILLLPLAITKYADFALNTANTLLNSRFAFLKVALPLGISFYTFQALSYTLDVYRGRLTAERSLLRIMAYLSFFPSLIAGPILRYSQMSAVLSDLPSRPGEDKRFQGLLLIISGLARKVLIADALGMQVDRLLAAPDSLGFITAWGVILAYGFQLYYDFSGYSQIAVGLAAWLGIQIPTNFDRPYLSRNISEFWRRWHITLSSWLRDYIFFPLSRTLLAQSGSDQALIVMAISHLTTMFVAGLWHGAAWTFVLWGVYHGLLLVLYHVTRPLNVIRWPVVNWLITFLAVNLGWVLFRSTSLDMAMTLYRRMLSLSYLEPLSVLQSVLGLRLIGLVGVAFALELVMPADFAQHVHPRWIEAVIFTALAVLALLSMGTTQRFLYFQF